VISSGVGIVLYCAPRVGLVALLEGSQGTDPGNLIVRARLDLGPRGSDLTDEC
jgi:hypothetical protein